MTKKEDKFIKELQKIGQEHADKIKANKLGGHSIMLNNAIHDSIHLLSLILMMDNKRRKASVFAAKRLFIIDMVTVLEHMIRQASSQLGIQSSREKVIKLLDSFLGNKLDTKELKNLKKKIIKVVGDHVSINQCFNKLGLSKEECDFLQILFTIRNTIHNKWVYQGKKELRLKTGLLIFNFKPGEKVHFELLYTPHFFKMAIEIAEKLEQNIEISN